MRMLLLLVAMFSVSCSKESANEALADAASKGIALALQCSNPEAIKADLLAKLGPKVQGVGVNSVGSAICQQAVVIVLPVLLGSALNQVPKEWGCSADAAKLGLTELAKRACALVP